MLSTDLKAVKLFLENKLNTHQKITLSTNDATCLIDTLGNLIKGIEALESRWIPLAEQEPSPPSSGNVVSIHSIRKQQRS